MRLDLLSAVLFITFHGINGATVKLGKTTLTGTNITSLGQEFFAGIPFAEPPTGSRRLRAPVLKTALKGATFNATAYGPACIQVGAPSLNVSEDCLTINVLRPSGIPANAKLPVLTWVYGGGFANGFAANYNGSAIVAQSVLRGTPVIYVNFNYRVGPLGFPQGSEAAKAGALNLGLKDQLAALEWIQANIGAFGGDKSKVTVFGESAGAASISILMLRPSFKKLARAAILESGSWATSITNYAATREANWELFVKALPACAAQSQSGSVKCLKSATLDAGALVAASSAAFGGANESFPFVPTLDGLHGVYPALGSISLATGIWSKIPFITGCNKDEGTAFINYPQYVTSTTAETWIRTNFTPSLIPFVGEQLLDYGVQGLLKLYPSDPAQGAPFGTGNQTFGFNPEVKRAAALVSDLSFHSQRRFSQELAAAQGVQSFGYHFIDPQPLPAYLGVTHGQEVNYVFGNCATKSPASQLLCLNMINYWVSFATSLTPNDGKGGSRPEWPQYARVSPSIIQLNGTNTTSVPDTYRQEQIRFINANSLIFHHRREEE